MAMQTCSEIKDLGNLILECETQVQCLSLTSKHMIPIGVDGFYCSQHSYLAWDTPLSYTKVASLK